MTENIEAIVLGYTKFGENSVVVHTLSEAYGRRGFLVRVGRKAGMALLLPLNILEMDIVPNPKSTLWSARNLTAKDPLNGIRNNLYKNTMSLFLSEVLLRAVKDGQAEDGLYPWCVRSILTLDSLDSDFSNFHIRFLLEFAGALGFSPTFEDIADAPPPPGRRAQRPVRRPPPLSGIPHGIQHQRPVSRRPARSVRVTLQHRLDPGGVGLPIIRRLISLHAGRRHVNRALARLIKHRRPRARRSNGQALELRQARTILEGAIAEARHRARNGEGGKAGAIVERGFPDACQSFRKRDRCQTRAT